MILWCQLSKICWPKWRLSENLNFNLLHLKTKANKNCDSNLTGCKNHLISFVGPPCTSSAVTWAAKLRERLAAALAISCCIYVTVYVNDRPIVGFLPHLQSTFGLSLRSRLWAWKWREQNVNQNNAWFEMMWTYSLSKRMRAVSLEYQRVSAVVLKNIYKGIIQWN